MDRFIIDGVAKPLSRLVLGTMTFGDTVDAAVAARMVDAALEAGITGIDTANGYAGGRSEAILAELVAGRRDRMVLATKAGMYGGDAGGAALLSAAGLRRSLLASLARLDVEDVDIFYLHQPDRSVPMQETLETLAGLVEEGLIGSIGVSNYAAWQVAEMTAVAAAMGAPPPVIAQQLYNLVARRIEDEYAEFALSRQLATVVYNPLGGGLLTGRHRFDVAPAEGRYGSSALSSMYRNRYWNEQTFATIGILGGIAEKAGMPLAELSLRWLLSKPVVSAVLIGGSTVAQLHANIAAAEAGPLEDDVITACDAAGIELAGTMPAYHR